MMTENNPHTRPTLDFERDPWDDTVIDPTVEITDDDLVIDAPLVIFPEAK